MKNFIKVAAVIGGVALVFISIRAMTADSPAAQQWFSEIIIPKMNKSIAAQDISYEQFSGLTTDDDIIVVGEKNLVYKVVDIRIVSSGENPPIKAGQDKSKFFTIQMPYTNVSNMQYTLIAELK